MLERECVGVKFKMLTILAVLATNVDYVLTLANQHSKDVATIKILSRTLSSTLSCQHHDSTNMILAISLSTSQILRLRTQIRNRYI